MTKSKEKMAKAIFLRNLKAGGIACSKKILEEVLTEDDDIAKLLRVAIKTMVDCANDGLNKKLMDK